MKKMRTPPFLLGLAAVLVAAGCGTNGRESAERMTSFESAKAGSEPTLFRVPQEQMSHVEIVTVTAGPLKRTLRLPGQVSYNGYHTTPVITQVSGPVSRLLVYPGQHVEAGQPMLEIASPDFAQLRASYLKAHNSFTVANKNYQRAEDLYAHHAISEQDLLQAQSNRTQAEADTAAAAQALRILGITHLDALSTSDPASEVPLRAPIAGEVVDRQCSPGQLLQAGATECYTISDMRTVWVLVNVFQNQLAYVHRGDAVLVETDAYRSPFHGHISYIAPSLDPATRTLQARIVTENPGERLKNQMYVTALVTAGTLAHAITVPAAAVLRNSENQPFVYVQAATDQFRRRLVEIGETQGGKIEILGGLSAGEKIVADGSLFLQFQNSLQR